MSRASVQETHIAIEAIEDGMLRLRGGRYRAVLEVESVNFDLLDEGAREAVIAGYTGFLSGLGFPVQQLVRVLPVDLEGYLGNLEARTRRASSGRLAAMAADHLAFVRGLARDRGLLERRGYIVVPADECLVEKSGLRDCLRTLLGGPPARVSEEAARSQLLARCEQVRDDLRRCDLASRRLGTADLVKLFHSAWCPELSRRQRLQDHLGALTAPLVTGRAGRSGRPPAGKARGERRDA